MYNRKLFNNGKINIHDLIFFVMIFFPITTILQGLPIVANINRIIIVFLLFGNLLAIFKDGKAKFLTFLFVFITVLLSIISIILLGGNSIHSFNDALYFPSWVLIMLYFIYFYSEFKIRVNNNINFICKMLYVWNLIVFISLFFSRAYTHHWGDGTYFQSFSNAEHRFAASCLFAMVLTFLVVKITKNKKNIILCLMPLVGIYLSGTRTYLAVLLLLLFGVIYKSSKNKVKFVIYTFVMTVLLILLLKITPMGEKILLTLQQESFRDPLATFTNGRSVFWNTQLSAFYNLGFFNIVFGAGYNFVYDVSTIWAHNDVINILLNFGYIGVFIYLYLYFKFVFNASKIDKNNNKFLFLIIILIWFINAMLNMVYTYLCASLCLPFVSYLLGGNYEFIEEKK